jgi:hypothetical protein
MGCSIRESPGAIEPRVKFPPKKVGLSPGKKLRRGKRFPAFSRVGSGCWFCLCFAWPLSGHCLARLWPELSRTILYSLQCCSRHLRSSIGPQHASLSQTCCITSNPGIQDKTSYYWQLLSFPGMLFPTPLHSTHALIDWTSRIPLIKPSDLTVQLHTLRTTHGAPVPSFLFCLPVSPLCYGSAIVDEPGGPLLFCSVPPIRAVFYTVCLLCHS